MSENTPVPAHFVILGAGPAGLAAGHELSVHGGKVTVLERNGYVGGLFRRLMGSEIVMVNRVSRIYYAGKYFFYPIRFSDLIRNTGSFTIAQAGLAFAWVVAKQALRDQPIVNMRDAYVAQFGVKLYDMFFRRYSAKVWGRPCEELSADWVSQRSRGLSIWSMVREALLAQREKTTSLSDNFMYPRDGYVRIPERMAEEIIASDNRIELNAAVEKVIYHAPNGIEVVYRKNGELTSARASAVLSTIPLGLLAKMLVPACDRQVEEAAQNLVFRDLITVNVILKKRQVSRDTWLYVQDEDVFFGRLHEPKNWSAAMVADDQHTSLVLECFCSFGDATWRMSDAEITERCVRDLAEKLRFIREDEVEDSVVVRTRFAYPVYDLGYAEKIAVIKAYLERFAGLYIVGRGGTFRYNNADHSIEMGLLLGQKLLGYDIDHMAVNTEPEYHEIKRGDELKRDHFVYVTGKSKPRPVRSREVS